MSAASHQISSEMAYDLVQDHRDTIVALLDHPMAYTEAVNRLGSEKAMERLLRHGLITREGDTVRAVSGYYHQLRQEGMVTFLERYVLPDLSATIEDQGMSTLHNIKLSLSDEQMAGLRQGHVQEFLAELSEISDQPADGVVQNLTFLVVGTSRVANEDMDPANAALHHLQQASLQRATPDEKDLALLTQGEFLADNGRYRAALSAMEKFLNGFKNDHVGSNEEANYHLTIASHWRSASTNDHEDYQEGREPC